MIKSLVLSSLSSFSVLMGTSISLVNSKVEEKFQSVSSDNFLKSSSSGTSTTPESNAWTLIYHSGSFSHLNQLITQLNITDTTGNSQVSSGGLLTSGSEIYPEKLQKLINSFFSDFSWVKLIEPLDTGNKAPVAKAPTQQSSTPNTLFPAFKTKFLSLNHWIEVSVFTLVIGIISFSSLASSSIYFFWKTKGNTAEKFKELLFNLITQLPGWVYRYYKEREHERWKPEEKPYKPLFNGGSISVSNLNYFSEEGNHILKNIDCEIKENEFYAIIGANGAGKTTLLKHLGKILPAQQGDILLSGSKLSSLDNKEFWSKVAYIPQELNIQIDTPVYDFLLYSRFTSLARNKKAGIEDHLKVLQAIKKCQIQHLRWSKMGELSGGQRQKVILASILVKDAELILLDEPTTFLDIDNRNFLISFFKELHLSGKTIIANLHKFVEVNQLATKVIALKEGSIQEINTKEKILQTHFLNRLYDLELSPEKWESLMYSSKLNY